MQPEHMIEQAERILANENSRPPTPDEVTWFLAVLACRWQHAAGSGYSRDVVNDEPTRQNMNYCGGCGRALEIGDTVFHDDAGVQACERCIDLSRRMATKKVEVVA